MTSPELSLYNGTYMTTPKKQKGLGRGLDALFGDSNVMLDSFPNTSGTPATLTVTQLQAGKYQPRTQMDDTNLSELAASIKAQGLIQPIIVREIDTVDKEKRFEIIAGERRFRACQIAGLTDIPVVVKNVDDKTAAAMALIENIQREDLNPMEEAKGIQRLIAEFDFTHEIAAQAVGRSRSAVSNILRLLNLAAPVQSMLMAGSIDMGHARALLAVDAATQILLANEVVARELSVRETEKLVAKTTEQSNEENPAKSKAPKEKSRDILRLEENLSDRFATNVNIKINSKNKGVLQIEFADLDVLDSVLARIQGEES